MHPLLSSNLTVQVCESIFSAYCFIEGAWDPLVPNDQGPRELEGDEAQAVINLFKWTSRLALPSSEFVSLFDENAEATEGMYSSALRKERY